MNNDCKIFVTNMETGEMTEFTTGDIVTVPDISAVDHTVYLNIKFKTCGTITGTVTMSATINKNISRVSELKEKLFWAVVEQKLNPSRKKNEKNQPNKKANRKIKGVVEQMTNREWLATLTNRELGEFLCSDDFQVIKRSYAQSSLGVAEWLGQEYRPIERFESILEYLRRGYWK